MILWLGRIGLLLLIGGFFYAVHPKSKLHAIGINLKDNRQKIILGVVLLFTLVLVVLPMSINPIWNGEIPEHRNQYETIAQAFLEGRLDFGYQVDPKLVELENPYDPNARKSVDASFYWDHAYYEGKYYMYFGVVPVILLFLPYLAITGTNLPTYIATAIFCSAITIGIFTLFLILSKRLFSKSINFVTYLCLSVSLSLISTSYCIKYPALYCTAISSGVAFALLGCTFWYASQKTDGSWKRWSLFLGSFCMSLVFGCRPQIGLVTFIAAPFLFYKIKSNHSIRFVLKEVACVVLPFVIIAPGLMWYNYARFGSITDFGAFYNLTLVDMTTFKSPITSYVTSLIKSFIGVNMTDSFPYVTYSGIFFQFPILLSFLATLGRKRLRNLFSVNSSQKYP